MHAYCHYGVINQLYFAKWYCVDFSCNVFFYLFIFRSLVLTACFWRNKDAYKVLLVQRASTPCAHQVIKYAIKRLISAVTWWGGDAGDTYAGRASPLTLGRACVINVPYILVQC